ncbi:MAG: hypothetical protein V2A34_10960 [Lentisphaerota bacterium]
MICYSLEDRQRDGKALGQYLATEIKSVCPELELHPEFLAELTTAVARYCQDQGCERNIPSGFLSVLLSRALRGIGEHEAAARVESRVVREDRCAETFASDLWTGPVTPETWNLFATRLLRPSQWTTEDGEITWVLDFSRIGGEQEMMLELALLPGLRLLIEQLAGVWDASSGAGVLGLKAVQDEELMDYCGSILEKISAARGWKNTPRTVQLDVPVRKKARRIKAVKS